MSFLIGFFVGGISIAVLFSCMAMCSQIDRIENTNDENRF